MRFCGTLLAIGSAFAVTACQTLAHKQGEQLAPKQEYVKPVAGFESAGMVDAAQFLGTDLMASDLYRVKPEAWNDGYANTYQIETPKYLFVVQGTERAKARIHEITATEAIRHDPTALAVANAVKDKSLNLFGTPIRSAKFIGKRVGEIENGQDALFFIPSGIGELITHAGHGLGELGFTAGRILHGAAGTKCSGLGCISKAGSEILSGTNSVLGKHEASRKFHAKYGTNPYTDNKVLQRQIDRLAYADSYTGAAYKIIGGRAGVKFWSPWIKDVGYYNNTEFVLSYNDAYRQENREKNILREWGASEDTVTDLYANTAFTQPMRTRLVKTLSSMGTPDFRLRMLNTQKDLKTRYAVDQSWIVLDILAGQEADGNITAYMDGIETAIGIEKNGNLLLPLAVDYLKWTPEIADLFARLQATGHTLNLVVKGDMSAEFIANTSKYGINLTRFLPPRSP